MKQIFIDIETNKSLNPKTAKIKQIAFIYKKNGVTVKKVNIKTNVYKRFIQELDKIIDKYNSKDKAFFIAYNAQFDNSMIRELFSKNKNKFFGSYFYSPHVDVMQLAVYKFMGKKKKPANFKLSTVCKFLKIKVLDSKLHDGLYDATITEKLYRKLIKL